MKILSYNKGSLSAKILANALGIKRIKSDGSKYRARPNKVVINWGCSTIPPVVRGSQIINANAKNAQNKLQAFKRMQATVPIPEFTEDRDEAVKWLQEGIAVVCRTVLNGHSGIGIIIADKPDELVDAPLYVKYVPKKDEYRVHVFKREAIHIQRKARKHDAENPNWRIRNLAGGFVYAIGDCNPDASVTESAVKAIAALDLDFGAVDVIWNDKKKAAYVLEVNTAPGLGNPSTLEAYVKAFKSE